MRPGSGDGNAQPLGKLPEQFHRTRQPHTGSTEEDRALGGEETLGDFRRLFPQQNHVPFDRVFGGIISRHRVRVHHRDHPFGPAERRIGVDVDDDRSRLHRAADPK